MELYSELATYFLASEGTPLRIAGIEFWMEGTDLVYTPATSKWNPVEMGQEVAKLARIYPQVRRIVARYA